MLFNVSLHLALAALIIGLAWRLWTWLSRGVGVPGPGAGAAERVRALARGLGRSLTSPSGLRRLAAAFFLDGLLQRRVFRENPWRWLAHQGIFWGIVLLVLLHALEHQISERLFADYYPTRYPYSLMRDVLGLAVLAGLAGFAIRRWSQPVVRRVTGVWDVAVLALLAVILLSGFGLNAVKITSQTRFNQMENEYAGLDPGPERTALETYWQQRFGVVFSGGPRAAGPAVMAKGREAHQAYCADCHSRPQAAFGSWALSRLLAPAAIALDSLRADHWLWQLHFLACFLTLALLPFSKLLHIFTTPLSLMADAVMERSSVRAPEPGRPAGRAARRALGLDACTHCGTCSQHCSVLAASRVLASDLALPSLKLAALAGVEHASPAQLSRLRQGADLCTRCQRCTRVCPAGIDLQDLWRALDEEMESRGEAPVYDRVRDALEDNRKANGGGQAPPALTVPGETRDMGVLEMALQYGYFRYCFQCQTCSNVCPVVASFEHSSAELGLLPHQIMYSLELGLVDQAVSAAMTWDCATCYQCQEHCPQKVPVADLLYELRNQGFWLGRGEKERRS